MSIFNQVFESKKMKRNITELLDTTGAFASWLCAVHCIVLPFTIPILALIGLSFLLDETTELILIGISIVIGTLSLLPSFFKYHRKLRTLLLFISGISLILISHLSFEDNLTFQIPFLLVGAGLITTAHLINRRLCQECEECLIPVTQNQ